MITVTSNKFFEDSIFGIWYLNKIILFATVKLIIFRATKDPQSWGNNSGMRSEKSIGNNTQTSKKKVAECNKWGCLNQKKKKEIIISTQLVSAICIWKTDNKR